MKLHISQQVYDQLPMEDRRALQAVACECVETGVSSDGCPMCDGAGKIYEWQLSAEESANIQDSLRRAGVPLGKIGTN